MSQNILFKFNTAHIYDRKCKFYKSIISWIKFEHVAFALLFILYYQLKPSTKLIRAQILTHLMILSQI